MQYYLIRTLNYLFIIQVRILIFHMSDTFLAISIEKEDELEKYRKVKD